MAVRNFYIDARIDGRKTDLSGGPASKNGGMEIVITQRQNGRIVTAFEIHCEESLEKLITEVTDGDGTTIGTFVTDR